MKNTIFIIAIAPWSNERRAQQLLKKDIATFACLLLKPVMHENYLYFNSFRAI